MLKKIGLGAGLWGIMFLAVSALMVTPLPGLWQKILEIIIAGVAAYILAMVHFKKSPGSIKDGVMLYVIWFIVGGILDLLVTIQYVKGNGSYTDGLKIFYGQETLWVSFVVALLGVLVAAKLTKGSSAPITQQPPMSSPNQPRV